jgi:DNA invertase Pin-like site-specific DNA recombinase
VIHPNPAFVTYLRVSTEKQGRSGLGLDAQRAAIAVHVGRTGGRIVAEHVEVESGRKKDRPQLAAALEACRKLRAVLLIAKLDRLARNVAFVSNLMDSGIDFVVADMPTVNRLTDQPPSRAPGKMLVGHEHGSLAGACGR